jgi:hypothetical protein
VLAASPNRTPPALRRRRIPLMTLYRGTFVDCPDDPFAGARLRALTDGGVLVRGGVVVERVRRAQIVRIARATQYLVLGVLALHASAHGTVGVRARLWGRRIA